jgi:NAD(P)-dependent dehydrogenase (short-subunit alcohol dehydrogenase family)
VKDFAGKVAVVTGAASGIGFALAERFAREGMRVVLADIETDALARAAERLGANAAAILTVPTDVSSLDSVLSLAEQTGQRFGPVDILCNNAGVERLGITTWDTPMSLWQWTLGVNLWGVIHGIRAFVPAMVERNAGHIVNTASVAGLVATPEHAPYTAAKHAVVGISEGLFHEFRARDLIVTVSVLCPNMTQTRLLEADRNWPAEFGALPERQGSMQEQTERLMATAMSPAAVAAKVLDAIAAERFWILTNDDDAKWVVSRFSSLLDNSLPPSSPGRRYGDAPGTEGGE